MASYFIFLALSLTFFFFFFLNLYIMDISGQLTRLIFKFHKITEGGR